VGDVSTGIERLFGDALLTADGTLRLYVGDPLRGLFRGPADAPWFGKMQTEKPVGSVQFLGGERTHAITMLATPLSAE
jgi:hypothetical protein